MLNKTPSFTLLDANGNTILCDLLFTFDCDENGKKYIVYTDNSRDKEGNIQVFASTYQMEGGRYHLMPLATEKEWRRIEIILEELKAEVEDNTL